MLSSSPVFCQSDTVSNSERFYLSNLKLFNDVEELKEVNDLLAWWNQYEDVNFSLLTVMLIFLHIAFRQIFPNQCVFCCPTQTYQSQA